MEAIAQGKTLFLNLSNVCLKKSIIVNAGMQSPEFDMKAQQNAKRRSNTTRKHTRTRGKRENWTPVRNNAHGNLVPEAEKREPENEVEHMVDKNCVICPE